MVCLPNCQFTFSSSYFYYLIQFLVVSFLIAPIFVAHSNQLKISPTATHKYNDRLRKWQEFFWQWQGTFVNVYSENELKRLLVVSEKSFLVGFYGKLYFC
jgi:hypothetical protein